MNSAADVPPSFEREMSAGEAEWQRLLGTALGPWAWRSEHCRALIELPPGQLRIEWQPLPPRRIALLRLPRLRVRFMFDGVAPVARRAFMAHFERYTHRGGG